MTKEELLNDLKKYSATRDNRLKKIENTIRGIKNEMDEACVKLCDCSIDIWMRRNEAFLFRIFGNELVNELYLYHEEWHEECGRICEMSTKYFKKNSSFIGRILGDSDIKIQGGERDLVLAYLDNLREVTTKVKKVFDKMLKRAIAMPEEMLKRVENEMTPSPKIF